MVCNLSRSEVGMCSGFFKLILDLMRLTVQITALEEDGVDSMKGTLHQPIVVSGSGPKAQRSIYASFLV